MTNLLNVSFYINKNKGSEYEVGYKYAYIQSKINKKVTVICPLEEILAMDLKIRSIGHFNLAREGNILFIAFKKIPSQIYRFHRINYFIWVLFVQVYFLIGFRKSRGYHFVTPVQAYSPIIIQCVRNVILGPMSVFPTWLAFSKNVPFKIRAKSFISLILANTFLLLKIYCCKKCKYIFVHKFELLHDKPNVFTLPSLFFDYKNNLLFDYKNKKNIVFSGRDVAVKNVTLHENIFKILSHNLPNYNFILISDRYKNNLIVDNNLLFSPILDKDKYYNILDETILNVFLSFEMGGISSLEACMYGAPSLTLERNGVSEYLKPSKNFIVQIELLNKPHLIAKVIEKIINEELYKTEIDRQLTSLKLYNSDNTIKGLKEVYK